MLKLVTQFDDFRMKPHIAAQGCCCCCCCCCCCVVTTLTTSVLTCRHVAHALSARPSEDIGKKPLKYKLIAFFAFPLSIAFTILTMVICVAFNMDEIASAILYFGLGIGVYAGLMTYLVKKANVRPRTAVGIIILSIVMLVVEFVVWLYVICNY